MGAGASLDGNLAGEARWFCHSCRHVFSRSSSLSSHCPICSSNFVEEFGNEDARDGHRHLSGLSAEQARRLQNAAIMLRLLENQLREELQMLQNHYGRHEQLKDEAMTERMREKLREPILDSDMICSQPSCPICSDDFQVGDTAMMLPCSHLYHGSCVVQWLDSKKNCPICRCELNDELITLDELRKFSIEELRKKYSKYALDEEVLDTDSIGTTELAEKIHELLRVKENSPTSLNPVAHVQDQQSAEFLSTDLAPGDDYDDEGESDDEIDLSPLTIVREVPTEHSTYMIRRDNDSYSTVVLSPSGQR